MATKQCIGVKFHGRLLKESRVAAAAGLVVV